MGWKAMRRTGKMGVPRRDHYKVDCRPFGFAQGRLFAGMRGGMGNERASVDSR
jgi:hypothetical protein